jgi:hypothetical protein
MNTYFASLLRHLLTAAGGFLVAKGFVSTNQAGELVGAAVTASGVAWSIYNAKKNADAAGQK